MSAIALDTNLFVRTAVRRFAGAMQEMRRDALVLLPTVREEFMLAIEDMQANRTRRRLNQWRRTLGREPTPAETNEQERRELRSAFAWTEGYRTWFEGEIARNDRPWELPAIAPHTASLYQGVLNQVLRSGAFRVPEWKRMGNRDPHIVTQAILAGIPFLLSDNLSTLDADALNRWCDERRAAGAEGFEQAPRAIAWRPDTAVAELARGDPETIGRWAIGACVPDRHHFVAQTDAQLRTIVIRFAEDLRAGALPLTATTIEELITGESAQNLRATCEAILDDAPQRTRESAARWVRHVRPRTTDTPHPGNTT